MMNIKEDIIPTSHSNRPNTRINPTYITIHETANTKVGANAEMHAHYVKGADARARQVSWHFTVDDKQIIQHLPLTEMGWHAGASGNRQSIGIELCVNSDGNFEQTKRNAQWLINKLMSELGIPIERVVTHKHWTGKNCPATLISTFESFKKGVIDVANRTNEPSTWAKKDWDEAVANGYFDGTRPKDNVTREEMAIVVNRLRNNLTTK